ncbi:MAG: hypothetical protein LQ339_000500 [Xanthoria mediterranea]|nr:MAG: hypothetical protein LQ339_000500 [Xanthoria mediterranea]
MGLPIAERARNTMRPLLHDTSYDCAPHCEIKIKCQPHSKPHTDCLGHEVLTTTAVVGKADPKQGKVHFGQGASASSGPGSGDGQGRRKQARLRLGMRWASTGNLKGVVG